VQSKLALAVLPASSVAVTTKRCDPSARPSNDTPLTHDAAAPPSNRQLVAPSDTEKPNTAEDAFECALGASVIATVGAVASTVHESEAGVGSDRPPGSTARTASECAPSARSLPAVYGDGQA